MIVQSIKNYNPILAMDDWCQEVQGRARRNAATMVWIGASAMLPGLQSASKTSKRLCRDLSSRLMNVPVASSYRERMRCVERNRAGQVSRMSRLSRPKRLPVAFDERAGAKVYAQLAERAP
jgi:hypothetical protein